MLTSFIVYSESLHMNVLFFFISCITLDELAQQVDLQVQTWCAPSRTAYVERVYDGDTLFLQGEEDAIRLLGVSAPEVDNPPECYGEEAGDFLASLVLGEQVILEYDMECTDIYNRQLAWIVLEGEDASVYDLMEEFELEGRNEDGSYRLLVNELIIGAGYAEMFQGEIDKSERYRARIEDAESRAEAVSIGLWAECP